MGILSILLTVSLNACVYKSFCAHSANLINRYGCPSPMNSKSGNTSLILSDLDYLTYTNFNRITYFQYLYNYSACNDFGSCGYVSLIQLMSYYDTFYNDNIIPETYDFGPSNNNSLSEAYTNSPGVKRQGYNIFYFGYYNFCNSTQGTNFQSKLIVLQNTIMDTNNSSNFDPAIGAWHNQTLLNTFYGSNTNVVVNEMGSGYTNEQLVNAVKNYIDNGIPVVVHISNANETSAHSVVAYDYEGDIIYANFGWGSADTHKNLFSSGFTKIYHIASLDFSNMGHYHSGNYIVNYDHYCGCNPYNINF